MFKHILLPTDGSPLAEAAAAKGVELARKLGARLTAIHVSPRFHVLTYRPDALEDTRDEYERDALEHAKRYLGFVSSAARDQGVACETLRVVSDDVHESIIDAARKSHCDLIAMASHGRRGIKGVLLGSETQRVLAHCAIPVLVWR